MGRAGGYGAPVEVEIGGRTVRVSNPDRPYFPQQGLTKLDLVTYYAAVAPTMLTVLRERPTTLERWPTGVLDGVRLTTRDGPKGAAFYQRRVPQGAPSYVETVTVVFPSGRTAEEVCPTEPAVIGWAANLGTITFHPWPVRRADVDRPDELRLDFDPQPGAAYADAAAAALEARALMAEVGWTGWAKTSGGRGVHVYVRLQPRWSFIEVRHAAIAFGRELERRFPARLTMSWWKEERPPGSVFVDYNQNARDRTIASAWSVRARPHAPVSTPLEWSELAAANPLDLTVRTVPSRLAERGDPHAAMDSVAHDLTPVLEWYARDLRDRGLGDLPYPPEYPKMEGEPPRVQPSRKNPRNWPDTSIRG